VPSIRAPAQRDYESQTRSLRIGRHCTSIRLEMSFWDTLEEIAAKEEMSLAKFLTALHNEVLRPPWVPTNEREAAGWSW